jgi:hypothetical protein
MMRLRHFVSQGDFDVVEGLSAVHGKSWADYGDVICGGLQQGTQVVVEKGA